MSETQRFAIEGMGCEGCVEAVSKALSGVSGVSKAAVTFEPPRATLEATAPLSTEALNAVLDKVGDYRLTPIVAA
jgi:copper chaperone CopZ